MKTHLGSMVAFIGVVALIAVEPSGAHTTRTWTGNDGTGWNTPGSWDSGVPDEPVMMYANG